MSKEDLILKDWEMTKDRIKHFDDVVMRIRIGGIPIATAIQAAGFIAYPHIHDLIIILQLGQHQFQLPALSLIFLASALYLFPIALLDGLHYKLLLIAVNHAKEIESLDNYKGKLQITTKLTSPWLTRIHTFAAYSVYVFIAGLGLFLAIFLR